MKRLSVELTNGHIIVHEAELVLRSEGQLGFLDITTVHKPPSGGRVPVFAATYNPEHIVRVWDSRND